MHPQASEPHSTHDDPSQGGGGQREGSHWCFVASVGSAGSGAALTQQAVAVQQARGARASPLYCTTLSHASPPPQLRWVCMLSVQVRRCECRCARPHDARVATLVHGRFPECEGPPQPPHRARNSGKGPLCSNLKLNLWYLKGLNKAVFSLPFSD